MVLSIILMPFLYFNILFPIVSYFDIKYRKVPKKIFRMGLYFSFALIIFEWFIYFNNILLVVLGKIFFFLAFLLSFILFNLKILGGSDGKLIVLIFISHPVKFLNINLITSFFLLFSLCFISLFLLNFSLNKIFKYNCAFTIFFNSNINFSIFKRFYIQCFYRFLIYSKLDEYKEEKFLLKSILLIFNNETREFQVLVQYRPPLILLIIFSYLFVCLIKLVV